jgi:hypothetical protein
MKKFILLSLLMLFSLCGFGQQFMSKGFISNGDGIFRNGGGIAINGGDTIVDIHSSGDSLIFTTKGGKKFKAPVNPVDENKLNKKFGVIDSIRVSVTGDSTIFFSGTDTVMIGLLNPSTDPPADCEDLHGYISANVPVLDCSNPFVSLTASSNQADVSYQWDGSVSGDLGTSNPLFAFAAETVTLTVTNNTTACEVTVDFVITEDFTQPTLEKFILSPNIGNEVALGVFVTDQLSGREYDYSWAGTGIVTNSSAQIIRVNAAGSFTSTVVDKNNGCNQVAIVSVVAGDFQTSGGFVNMTDSLYTDKFTVIDDSASIDGAHIALKNESDNTGNDYLTFSQPIRVVNEYGGFGIFNDDFNMVMDARNYWGNAMVIELKTTNAYSGIEVYDYSNDPDQIGISGDIPYGIGVGAYSNNGNALKASSNNTGLPAYFKWGHFSNSSNPILKMEMGLGPATVNWTGDFILMRSVQSHTSGSWNGSFIRINDSISNVNNTSKFLQGWVHDEKVVEFNPRLTTGTAYYFDTYNAMTAGYRAQFFNNALNPINFEYDGSIDLPSGAEFKINGSPIGGGGSSVGSLGQIQFSDGAGGFTNSNGVSSGSSFEWDGADFFVAPDANSQFEFDMTYGSSYWDFNITDGVDVEQEWYMDPSTFYYDCYTDGTLGEIFLQNGGSTTANSEFSVTLSDETLLQIYYDRGGIKLKQLSGSLTDGTPTAAEITAIVGVSASVAGAGFQVTIKDSDGTGLLYKVESDGTNWFYLVMTQAS